MVGKVYYKIHYLVANTTGILTGPVTGIDGGMPIGGPDRINVAMQVVVPTIGGPVVTVDMFSEPGHLPVINTVDTPATGIDVNATPDRPVYISRVLDTSYAANTVRPETAVNTHVLITDGVVTRDADRGIGHSRNDLGTSRMSK